MRRASPSGPRRVERKSESDYFRVVASQDDTLVTFNRLTATNDFTITTSP